MSVRYRYARLSDIGLARSRNEDYSGLCLERHFYAVADGMGGHPAGDIASQAAIEAACNFAKDNVEEVGKRLIARAMEAANDSVYNLSRSDRSLRGMGTTLCCLLLQKGSAYFGHVGDSRIYLWRGGELIPLTENHSLVAQLIKAGQLDPGEAQVATYKHVVTRAVGTRSRVLPTLGEIEFEEGDLFLICTDGLTDQLTDGEIAEVLGEGSGLEEIAARLVEEATRAGGEDNVTVFLVAVNR